MDPEGTPLPGYRVADRRAKSRIHAMVRGVDVMGDPFEAEAVLDNLSAGGRYMRLKRDVHEGLPTFIFPPARDQANAGT